MAVNKPDIYQHNNPNLAFVDSDFIKGGIRTSVANLAALYALSGKTGTQYASGQLKNRSTIVYVSGEAKYYILKDINNVSNANGWEIFVTGGGNGTLTGATNGLSLVKGGSTVSLGGALTGNTTISGNYTLNINGGAKLNTACGYQISGVTMFTTRSSLSNIAIGQNALVNNTTGCWNLAIGNKTLYCNSTGYGNVAIGYNALSADTIGYYNNAIGFSSLEKNNTGCYNYAFGVRALQSNISGCNNIAVGRDSLRYNISGNSNIGIGILVLWCNTIGNSNIAIGGYRTMCKNVSGYNNIALGNYALTTSITGNCNIAIGTNALYSNLVNENIAIGHYSLSANTTGRNNSAFGLKSLLFNTTGCQNVAVGNYSLSANTTGCFNVAIGYNSLFKNTTGYRNTSIGYISMCSNTTGYQNVSVGNGALCSNQSGSGNVALGQLTLQSNVLGRRNVAVGMGALNATKLDNNIGIGYRAIFSSSGSSNIGIGNCAGYNELGSGKLYIGTGDTALIMGDMTLPNECVILPYLKLRKAPTGSGGYLCYDPSTCLVCQTSGGTGGGVTPTSGLLFWDAVNMRYTSYGSKQSFMSFYTGITNPTLTTRLNLDADLHVPTLSVVGKLDVGGIIDPTGLQLDPVASNPGTTTTIWSNSGDSNSLYYNTYKLGKAQSTNNTYNPANPFLFDKDYQYNDYNLTANITPTIDLTNAEALNGVIINFIGDGIHTVDFSNFIETYNSQPFNITNGAVNSVIFYYDGNDVCYSIQSGLIQKINFKSSSVNPGSTNTLWSNSGDSNSLYYGDLLLVTGSASTSTFGGLTSTDWNTFNNKQNTISAGNGLSLSGNNLVLGGTLTGNTVIDLNKNIFEISNGSEGFNINSNIFGTGLNGDVYIIQQQSDGKILAGGYFTTYSGVTTNYIIRLNSNGSIDNTFNSGSGFNGGVLSLLQQTDGKILIGGEFTSYSGVTANYIIRLNPDGSIDNTFNSGAGFNTTVRTIKLLSDGKILIGGSFTTYSGVTTNYIIRLNPDGSIDNTFNIGTGFNNGVYSIVLQSDGKILVGGYFTTYSGVTANYIIRLNSNGTIDNTFNIGAYFSSGIINSIQLQSDGNILVGGYFSTYSGVTANRIIRLNSNGSIDNSFNSGAGFNTTVQIIQLQTDGKILIGGEFTSYSGVTANYIIRLNPDGSIDNTFNSGAGFNTTVRTIKLLSDGKILIGGSFWNYNTENAFYIIRLNQDGSNDNVDISNIFRFNGKVAEYGADYSQYYTARSIPDVAFVTGRTSTSGDSNNIYSTTIVSGNTTLTTGSSYVILVNSPTSISTITLPLTPINGEAFKIKDASGKALTYNITINGNGRNIDGSSTALINTDYGAVELLYNSSLNAWFAISFMY